ncbi:MAG: hypothetical protein KatS3mg034_0373 [Vicingaceae bacterium]|nr:MAG: hypothetical protein KatS3mg034_0373 [Vicingaceae bacterium]
MFNKSTPLILIFFVFTNYLKSQCPGCQIDTNCTIVPAFPGTCPADTMPPGTVGIYYDQDVTFYMPEYFQVTSPVTQMVHLDELKILNVTGLPMGLNWQTNSANNTYNPSPGNERGCAKLCGTPMIPGFYTVTIFFQVTVTPQSIGGQTTQNESTQMYITIYPNPSGNSAFTISNPVGCAPLTTTFSPVVAGNGNPLYSYYWDFGNNSTSTLENPPPVTYTTPGNYVVYNTTTISAYTLTDVTFNVGSNTNWCGDVEEPSFFGNCTGNPDLIFKLLDNTSNVVYTSNEISNSMTGTWNNLNILLQNGPYIIQFWDVDNISPDDNLGNFILNFTTTGTYNLSGGGASGTFTIGTQAINTISDTDTVVVYPKPPALQITALPNDTVCENDSIMLFVPGGYNYQWYNDSGLIYNATDSFIYVHFPGNYFVKIENVYGCDTISPTITVNFLPLPPKPNFWLIGNTLNCNLTGYALQWYLNGNPITGATGNSINITTTGYYHIIATDSFGCSNSSDTVLFNAPPNAIAENPYQHFKVYPNPNNGYFTIELSGNMNLPVNCVIVDLTGRVIFEKTLQANNGQIIENLDLAQIEDGTYLLILKNDFFQKTERIIVKK